MAKPSALQERMFAGGVLFPSSVSLSIKSSSLKPLHLISVWMAVKGEVWKTS